MMFQSRSVSRVTGVTLRGVAASALVARDVPIGDGETDYIAAVTDGASGPFDVPLDVEALLRELQQRVEARRARGEYPVGLEETLDEHFERLIGDRPAASPAMYEDLRVALGELERFQYSRSRIDAASELPGGTYAHRLIGKLVSRQIIGILEQSQEHAHMVADSLRLVAELASAIGAEYDNKVVQQLEDLQVRLAEQERALNGIEASLREVTARVPGVPMSTFYGEDQFTAVFRGSADALRARYRDLAEELVGCDPVLDVGFGRGEFLELLVELGVEARGIEADPDLVSKARGRGLDVARGLAVEHLGNVPDAGLGGLAMIQVIEHLAPHAVIEFVKIASEKVRPGGKVVVETVNPASLYTYAHAFWVDPDHVRPVHPNFLEFLFREAGFSEVRTVFRTPVDDGDALEMLPGDEETTKRLNANFERINSLLFGPQDYAIIATR
jgi:SAM-dependent methyltransferase